MTMVLVESHKVHRHGAWEQKGDYINSNGYHKMAALDEKETIVRPQESFPWSKSIVQRSAESLLFTELSYD